MVDNCPIKLASTFPEEGRLEAILAGILEKKGHPGPEVLKTPAEKRRRENRNRPPDDGSMDDGIEIPSKDLPRGGEFSVRRVRVAG